MSQEFVIHLKCDRHNVVDDGVRVRTFSIDGEDFEIEACAKDDKLVDPLLEWLRTHGRKQPKSTAKKSTPKKSTGQSQRSAAASSTSRSSTKAPAKKAASSRHANRSKQESCPVCKKPIARGGLSSHCKRIHQESLQDIQARLGISIVRAKRPNATKRTQRVNDSVNARKAS